MGMKIIYAVLFALVVLLSAGTVFAVDSSTASTYSPGQGEYVITDIVLVDWLQQNVCTATLNFYYVSDITALDVVKTEDAGAQMVYSVNVAGANPNAAPVLLYHLKSNKNGIYYVIGVSKPSLLFKDKKELKPFFYYFYGGDTATVFSCNGSADMELIPDAAKKLFKVDGTSQVYTFGDSVSQKILYPSTANGNGIQCIFNVLIDNTGVIGLDMVQIGTGSTASSVAPVVNVTKSALPSLSSLSGSVAYYLKLLNCMLIGGCKVENKPFKPCAGPKGAVKTQLAEGSKKISLSSDPGISVNDNQKLCLYSIDNLSNILTVNTQIPIASPVPVLPIQSTTYKLPYLGGSQEILQGDSGTFFYVGSACIESAGNDKSINPYCVISVDDGIWNNGKGFSINCASLGEKKLISNGANIDGTPVGAIPSLINLDSKTAICYPSVSDCKFTLNFNADTAWDNELYVHSIKSN
ncbi:Uncharacterised protein [uncultured archaeon]|nr:Uncharacterised protein [uncultured archaeon]